MKMEMYTISKNNTTGVRGVTFESHSHKYRAYIHIGGEKISLGYFNNIQDAAKARKEAEEFYKAPLTGRLRLLDFISQKYGYSHDYILSGVMDCLRDYKFGEIGFISYVLNRFRDNKDEKFFSEPVIPSSEILLYWMNGMSLNQIAKKIGKNPKEVKKIIEEKRESCHAIKEP